MIKSPFGRKVDKKKAFPKRSIMIGSSLTNSTLTWAATVAKERNSCVTMPPSDLVDHSDLNVEKHRTLEY